MKTLPGHEGTVMERTDRDVDEYLADLRSERADSLRAVEGDEYLLRSWADRLGKVKASSAAITFTSADALDLDQLRAMLARARALAPGSPGDAKRPPGGGRLVNLD